MTDTFDDLSALADLQPPDPRVGRMLVKVGERWSYPGCPTDGTNLVVPRSGVTNERVLAAIAAGVWSAFEVSEFQRPVKAIARDSPFWGRAALQPAEVNGPRSWPPILLPDELVVVFTSDWQRLGTFFGGYWIAAWQQGVVPAPDGAGLDRRLLVVRVPDYVDNTFPSTGNILLIGNKRYVVEATNADTRDVALSRYLAPNG